MRIEQSYELFTALQKRMVMLLQVMENPYRFEDRLRGGLDGSIKFADCHVVQKLLEAHKPQRCLEIGSFLGFSTRWLLECGRDWNMHVTAVDPNIRHRMFDNPRWMVEGMNACHIPDRLEVISGFFGAHGIWSSDYEKYAPQRSREWAEELLTSRREIDGGWGRTFDCIYIDANHSYPAVVDGFRNALPLLAPGGMMIFHDALSWEGVNKALKEFREEFAGRAEVEIIDASAVLAHPCLAGAGRINVDGIGFFKLLDTEEAERGACASAGAGASA